MRPRTELLVTLVAVAAIATAVGLLAGSNRRVSTDVRPSTLLSGPGGTSGYLEAVRAFGITVRRHRDRLVRLPAPSDTSRTLLAILDPTAPLTGPERMAVARFRRTGDLLIVGAEATPLMRCYGYQVRQFPLDSAKVRETSLWVHGILRPTGEAVATDSSRAFDIGTASCTVPKYARVTPLLTTERGVVAVRLEPADSSGTILLVADVAIFQNRTIRRHDNAAGQFVLGLVVDRYDRIIFDEYHHGFGAAGSLGGAVLAWSSRSPWGWAVWQLAAVGVLMLLVGAVRFGPITARLDRRRRDPLEHLQALATALAAAKGHDQAISAIVRGLRRRLSPTATRSRGDWQRWLVEQDGRTTSIKGRRALETLNHLTTPGQPASSVLQAANAAEELWQSIRT